ncbi:PKD domain-containing protein [Candidatus Woesearchaeota archaeon]|nr:PKD domain-containing protein [Candidatus Woesearchaeota archaeon]
MKKLHYLATVILLSTLVLALSIDISLTEIPTGNNALKTFSVSASSFDWQVDESKLCTQWAVYSYESSSMQKTCYGSAQCCALVEKEPAADNWDDDFSLNEGKLGATKNNEVSAQVIYADISFDLDNPKAEISYSGTASLQANFQEQIDPEGTPITLRIFHGTGSMDIFSLTPDAGTYYDSQQSLDLDYFVFHTTGTSVDCSLLLDNSIILQVFGSVETETLSTTLDLAEGSRSFVLDCADDEADQLQSSPLPIIMDYTAPSITLGLEDNFFTFMSTLTLDFLPVDNLAPQFDCSLFIDGQKKQDLVVSSGESEEITLTDLESGNHTWKVACTDLAGNMRESEERRFIIDLEQDFGLELNADTFSINQQGYYIITAPFGAEVTVLITQPNGETLFRSYSNQNFPVTDVIDFLKRPGSYKIEAVMIFEHGSQVIEKTFEVGNTFTVSIVADDTEISSGIAVTFESHPSGGIGGITYKWDFDDETTSTEQNPKHTFNGVRNYDVAVQVKDSVGNVASSTIRIKVKEQYNLDIIVKDISNKLLAGAKVFVEGDKKITNAEGTVSYVVLDGNHQVLVMMENYESESEKLEVTKDLAKTYYLNSTTLKIIAADPLETVEEEVPVPVAEVLESGSLLERVTLLVDALSDAIYTMSNLGKSELDAAIDLGIEGQLQEKKTNLLRIPRDLDGLQYFKEEDEKDQRRLDIIASVDEIEQNTIIGLKVLATEEYSAYPEEKEIEETLKRYAEVMKKEDKEVIGANEDIQKDMLIIKTVKNIELTMLSGETEEITLIKTDFDIKNSNENMHIIESIPKDLAKDTSEIEFLTPHQILESDPLVLFEPGKIKNIIYYLKKRVESEDTKKIVPVLIDPFAEPKKGLGISGFAVFSTFTGFENPLLAIQIALILLLLVVYVFYEFEILLKIRKYDFINKINPIHQVKKMINKDLHELHMLLKRASGEIAEERLDNAEDTYHDMIKIYNDRLGSDLRKKVIEKISSIYNELLVHRIKKKVKDVLNVIKSDKKQAKSIYNDIQELYAQLPKSWKVKVSRVCSEVFEMLQK